MLKVCRFNPIPGEWGEGAGGILAPSPSPPIFSHKIRTAIDFSQNFLTFNFYGQLKHDTRSLKYVSRCFVKRR